MKRPLFLVFFLLLQASAAWALSSKDEVTPLFLLWDGPTRQAHYYFKVSNQGKAASAARVYLQASSELGNYKYDLPIPSLAAGQTGHYKVALPTQAFFRTNYLILKAYLYNEEGNFAIHSSEEAVIDLFDVNLEQDDPDHLPQEKLFVLSESPDLTALILSLRTEVRPGSQFPKEIEAEAKKRRDKSLLWAQAKPQIRWYSLESPTKVQVPLISRIFPAQASLDVIRDPAIFVEFSDALDPESVQQGQFQLWELRRKAKPLAVQAQLEVKDRSILLKPVRNLQAKTIYEVRLYPGLKAYKGTALEQGLIWRFRTGGEVEKVEAPLEIHKIHPQENQENLPIAGQVRVAFNQLLDSSSLGPDNFFVMQGNNRLKGRILVQKNLASFVPSARLQYDTQYNVVLLESIKSQDGQTLVQGKSWAFKTEPKPLKPKTYLRLSGLYPGIRATGLPVETQVNVKFAQDIDPKTVTPKSFYLLDAQNQPVPGKIKTGAKEITFAPTRELSYNQVYSVSVTKEIQDGQGNSMKFPLRWRFQTRREIDYPSKKDSNLLIYSPSHEAVTWTKAKKGVLVVGVTSFSPILHLDINGQIFQVPQESQVEVKLPYDLKGSKNPFQVSAYTKDGLAQKTFNINLGNKPSDQSPLLMIAIFGHNQTDNLNNAQEGSSKTEASKRTLTLVPTYSIDLSKDSTLKLKAIVLREKHLETAYASKETSYSQVAVEWEEKKTFLGKVQLTIGYNDVGTNNKSLTLGESKLQTETFYEGKATVTFSKTTNFDWLLSYKAKDSVAVASSVDDETDARIYDFKSNFKTETWGLKHAYKLIYEINDAVGKYQDSKNGTLGVKYSYALGDWTPSLNYEHKIDQNDIYNPTDGVQTKKTTKTSTLKLDYKVFKKSTLGLSYKLKDQDSNLASQVYKVVTNELTWTQIF